MPASSLPSLSPSERSARTRELLNEVGTTHDEIRRRHLLAEVVEINIPVAHAIAARYRGRGVAQEDLEQAACEGLIKAVRRFDTAQADDLLTFAVPTIRGELQRYFRDRAWIIR
ncbi:MAG: sigma-70 family RNA polymerase sigma factor, partial [Nocardioides sp.]